MSWKNVKTHYRIGHIVAITSKGVCIGSDLVHDLIVVSLNGKIAKRPDRTSNEDLLRYLAEMDADPKKLKELIETPDTFNASVPVYTYDGGEVIQKLCETPGWPNVTHDGDIMYGNTYSTDKALVVEWAKANAAAGLKWARENLETAEQKVVECRTRLATAAADCAKLDADYPTVATTSVDPE